VRGRVDAGEGVSNDHRAVFAVFVDEVRDVAGLQHVGHDVEASHEGRRSLGRRALVELDGVLRDDAGSDSIGHLLVDRENRTGEGRITGGVVANRHVVRGDEGGSDLAVTHAVCRGQIRVAGRPRRLGRGVRRSGRIRLGGGVAGREHRDEGDERDRQGDVFLLVHGVLPFLGYIPPVC